MRPIQVTYSPITADTDLLNAAVTSTGAAIIPTTTTPTDGLSHKVTLTSAGGVDLSGVAFTVAGTFQGETISDVIAAGPNGTTVTTAKYFTTVTSVTPGATMATKEMTIGIGAESLTPAIPLDRHSLAASALTITVTGTINATVQDTIGDVFRNDPTDIPWTVITALTGKTAQTDGSVRTGATAVRILTNSVTNSATITLWISQPTQSWG